MRVLRSHADLAGVPAALLPLLTRCLDDWAAVGQDDDMPADGPVILVEQGDTGEMLAERIEWFADLLDDEAGPAWEWVSDHGLAFEACLILSDSGAGLSLVVPKDIMIDGPLLASCARLATPPPSRD